MKQNFRRDIRIFNNDSAKILKFLPDNSIDFIITDPPYFIDGMGCDWNDVNIKEKTEKARVVGSLPVGMKFEKEQGQRLQNFIEPFTEEFYRVLKPGAFCMVFSQARLYHRMAICLDNAGFEMRDMLVWKYEGQAKAFSQIHFIEKDKSLSENEKQNLIRQMKDLKTPQLKPQIEPLTLAQKPKNGTFVQNWIEFKTGLMNVKNRAGEYFPGNVIEARKNKDGNIEHPTVKPVNLISHLINLFTQKNQIVLDPFMGSGSHGVAALQNERKFIGIEIELKYFKIAEKRLFDSFNNCQMKLF